MTGQSVANSYGLGLKKRCMMTSVLPETDGRTLISKAPSTPFTLPGSWYIMESLLRPGFGVLQKFGVIVRVPSLKICWLNDSGKLWNGPDSSALRSNTLAE
jgi:hypothetical protein